MYDHNLADNEQPLLPFDHANGTDLQPNHQHQCGAWGIGAPASHSIRPPPTLCMRLPCQTAAKFLIRAAIILVLFLLLIHPKKPKNFSTDSIPTVRVYCKSMVKYSLTICDGKVALAPTNSSDPHQHWIIEEKFGKNVKDEEGHSSFALINKATGQAIKHSIGQTYPVQLIKYDPDKLDASVLWTRGVTQEEGYSAIRAVYNIHLNLVAYDCTKDLEKWAKNFQFSWNKGKNQLWNGGNNQLWALAFF